ncbi:MAG TPA: hypothetical protein VGI85_06810 [Chthoniobacterales bacterium]|jgi:hypothetical protein
MPRGANKKREREYKELERELEEEGRYKGREEEVAARIVNKQRAQYGETKAEKRKDRTGKSPDRDLPIKNYQHKTVPQVERALRSLTRAEVKEIERYEKQHKKRKTLLEAIHDHGNDGGSGSSKAKGSDTKTRSASRKHTSSRSRSAKSSKHSRSHNGTSDHEGNVTTDHDTIREWVEDRGGHPATVRSTVGKGHESGILRIDFPGYSGADSLEKITWEEFFDKFEKEKLAFLHQDRTAGGKKSHFSKLIAR